MLPSRRAGAPPLWHWLVPAAALVILGSGIDIAQWLRGSPLWVDEEMIAINVRDRPFSDLPGPLWLGQSAPLAWLVVQRGVLLAAGTSELSLRLVPLVFGIATLSAAAWIGRRWLTWPSAALLISLCALGQWLSHYRFEVKHYSADAFFALFLPALAAWALDGGRDRWLRWWLAAALGQWFANGALLVTPGCAVLMFAILLRRSGLRQAMTFALAGLVWLASMGVNYAVSLQYTHQSTHLRNYWSAHVPPPGFGPLEVAGWIAERLDGIASNPGGSTLGIALWVGAALGFLMSPHRVLAVMLASVPLAGFALAATRLVPFSDRIALWIIPSLYAGVALLLDAGIRYGREGWRGSRWPRLALSAAAAAFALVVGADVLVHGRRHLDFGAPRDTNHAVHDRDAVAWLMARRQAGDALITTRLGWPAVWWYGGIHLGGTYPAGRLPDGSVMFTASLEKPAPDCGDRLRDLLKAHRRILIYVGFPDMPEGFYERLVQELGVVGAVVESREYASLSRVAVIRRDIGRPGGEGAAGEEGRTLPEGCVTLGISRRW